MPLTSPVVGTPFYTAPFGTSGTLRDDFNRANEGPPPTGWTAWLSTGLKVDANQLAPADTGDNGGYYNTAMSGANVEAYITIAAPTVNGGENAISARCEPTGAGFNGTRYTVNYIPGASGTGVVRLSRSADLTGTLLDTTNINLTAGDKLGIRCYQSTIEGWVYITADSQWYLVVSAADTTYPGTGSQNKIAVYNYGNGSLGARYDDLYAGVLIGIANVDAATTRLSLTPSAVETTQGIDSDTIYLDLQPSGVDVYTSFRIDAGTAVLNFIPSGVEAVGYIDVGTVLLAFTPSAVEEYVPVPPPPPPPHGGIIPELSIPGPPPKKIYWTVIHYRHDGTAIGDEYPSNPEFALYLGKVGYLNYDLDKDSPLCTRENCEPYATDYLLKFGDREIQGGIHTDIQIDDIEGHTFQISGKDWLHWFEGQKWPFDPNNPLANVYSQFARDMFLVVEDWLTVIQSEIDTIQFIYANGLSGQTVNAKIDHSDTEDILSKITTLSQGNPGFDFEVTPDKHFNMYYPNKSRDIELVLEQGANIYQLSYHNKGPTGTRIFGQAQGPSSRLGSIQDHITKSFYRRWMVGEDFGDVPDVATLTQRTSGALERAASPHLEFTARIIPDFVEDLFSVIELGDNIPVYGRLGWDTIDDRFRLVSITGGPNDEGDQEFELGFDDGTISL